MSRCNNSWQVLASTELGGGELVALKLANSLNARGEKSAVLTAGDGPAQKYAEEEGIYYENYPLEQCSSKSYLRSLIGSIRSAKVFQKKRGDLLHFHSPFSYRPLCKILPLCKSGPTVVHIHLEYEKNGLSWALQYPPDVIVVCAKFLESYVRSCLPKDIRDSQRIEVLSNAVDLNKFYPAKRSQAKLELGLNSAEPIILMVADLAPHKGQRTLIKAMHQLKKEGILSKCWLVGRARAGAEAYEEELRSMVSKLGLQDEVCFKGQRSDIPELMRVANCLILPSAKEGLPLSILEAQASGLPVIAAPTSGIPEVILDNETGFLVAADDVNGYADRIKLLLTDQNVSQLISQNALKQCVEERSWDSYVDKTVNLYESLCQHSQDEN